MPHLGLRPHVADVFGGNRTYNVLIKKGGVNFGRKLSKKQLLFETAALLSVSACLSPAASSLIRSASVRQIFKRFTGKAPDVPVFHPLGSERTVKIDARRIPV